MEVQTRKKRKLEFLRKKKIQTELDHHLPNGVLHKRVLWISPV